MPSDAPDRRRTSQSEPEGTSFGAWALVWCLYLTKLATIVIVVLMQHSYDTAVFVTITTWFWFGPLLALGAAPLLFRWRLRRVRRRRADLQRAEWEVPLEWPAIELERRTHN
ncbi:MAG: hypothetical protein IT336_05990 [Thermomicrobiales bacterium]|nr:hypothetical protein [Thermomicrobiales bacterium]